MSTPANNLQNDYFEDICAFIVNGQLLPDGDICEFLWSNSDAL